jgi:hypothetical protein
LEEEMNNKKVIEEYVEDKSSVHQSRASLRDSFNGSGNQLIGKQKAKAPILKDTVVSMQDINMNNDHNIPSYHGS